VGQTWGKSKLLPFSLFLKTNKKIDEDQIFLSKH
jgi:hypothetical protein